MAKTLKEFIAHSDKIGHYQEATGGGTPLKKGEKLKNHPEAKRVMQPRDEEGRFAHNSVNLKTLKYKSRGKTVPAFLRDIEVAFAKYTGNFSLVDKEGKRYTLPYGIKNIQQLKISMSEYLGDGKFAGDISLDDIVKKKGGKPVSETYVLLQNGILAIKKAEGKGKYYDLEYCEEIGVKQSAKKPTKPVEKKAAASKPVVDTNKIDLSAAKENEGDFYEKHGKEIASFMEKFEEKTGEKTTKEEIRDIIIENGIGSFSELNDIFDSAI